MGLRLDLHEALVTVLGSECKVYFQPPENIKMSYPCFVYNREDIQAEYANDIRYRVTTRYQGTLISSDPDNTMVDKILELPYCSYDRFFTADNLNHDVFTIYF